jgi:hypothetical protein
LFESVTKSADSFRFVLKVSPPPARKIKAQNNFKTLREFEEVLYFGEGHDTDRCDPPEELCLPH